MSGPPARIGRWTILGELGRGGAGVVYAAEPHAAVKLLHHGDPRALGRELAVLSSLAHPAIVRILDHGAHEGRGWYAMERIVGPTLQDSIDRAWATSHHTIGFDDLTVDHGRSDPALSDAVATLLGAVARLARTLAWLHGEGLAHRDLKPVNVMLRDGAPVLVDFGLAVGFEGKERVSDAAQVAGSVGYVAPEQALGLPVDARADLFSLGCMVWACLTGASPLAGSPTSVVRRLRAWRPVRPSAEHPDVPHALDDLVFALLQPDPRDRPASATTVAETLEALGVAEPPVGWPTPRPTIHRAPLVGREDALARVVRVAMEGRDTGARIYVRSGPGLGRSRLLVEAIARLRPHGFRVWTGRGLPEQRDLVPLHPLGALLGAVDGTDPFHRRPEGTVAEPWSLAQTVVVAARRLAAARPVLLVLDDLHDADAVTVQWLAQLGPEMRAAPFPLVVLGALDPDQASLALRAVVTDGDARVDLGPLEPSALSDMAHGMMGEPPPVTVAHGNPSLLTELVRAAADGLPPIAHPTLDALATARVARLDPGTRAVAAAAAVLGPSLSEARLEGLLGAPVPELHALLRARILERIDGGLRFVHDAARHAAAACPADRAALHRRAAALLHDAPAAVIAGHLEAAGDDARNAWARAARELLDQGAIDAAAAALDRGARTPDTMLLRCDVALARSDVPTIRACVEALDGADRGQALRRLGQALLLSGDADAARRAFLDAAPLGDADLARAEAANALVSLGHLDRALEEANAVRLAVNPSSLAGVEARNTLGRVAFDRSDPREAERWWSEALPHAVGAQRPRLLGNVATALRGLAEREAALRFYRESVEESLRLGLLGSAQVGLANVAGSYLENGQDDVARGCFGAALRLTLVTGHRGLAGIIVNNLGQWDRMGGALASADALLGLACDLATAPRERATVLPQRMMLRLEQGDWAAAAADGRAALEALETLRALGSPHGVIARIVDVTESGTVDAAHRVLMGPESGVSEWEACWLRFRDPRAKQQLIDQLERAMVADPTPVWHRQIARWTLAPVPPSVTPLPPLAPPAGDLMCDPLPLIEVARRRWCAAP